MTKFPMDTAPKDGTKILLEIDGVWIQGHYFSNEHSKYWQVVSLDSHGCGCCAGGNSEPTGWAQLPQEPING